MRSGMVDQVTVELPIQASDADRQSVGAARGLMDLDGALNILQHLRRQLADVIRLHLAPAKVPYVDFRCVFSSGAPGNFSTVSWPEFDAAKAAGESQVSMLGLPIFETMDRRQFCGTALRAQGS